MSGYFGGRSTNSLVFWHNPLIGRGAGRQILEIPFDDSIDGTNALECFFQMPSQVHGVRSAYVWVQSKPFRQYVSGISGGTSSSTPHTHAINGSLNNTGTEGTEATSGPSNTMADHSHADPQGGVTAGANPIISGTYNPHTHNGPSHVHLYTVASMAGNDGAHTHTVTPALSTGIFETAAAGTLSLAVADDGVNYAASIVSGIAVATGITKQTLTGLTKASGDKRIKITGTGLCRLQVLIVLDLSVAVLS